MKPMWIFNLPKPFSCRVLAGTLTRYAEAAHTLPPGEQTGVAAHLSVCASCREEVETVRAVGQTLRKRGHAALPAHVPSADLWARIEGRIIEDAQVAAQPRRRASAFRPVLMFAPALAAVVVAAIFVPRLTTAPQSKNAVPETALVTAPKPQTVVADAAAPVKKVAPKPVAPVVIVAAVPRPAAPKPVGVAPRRPVAPSPRYVMITAVAAPEPVVARAKRTPRRSPVQVATHTVKPRLVPQAAPTPAPITIVAVNAVEPVQTFALSTVAVEPKITAPYVASAKPIRIVHSDTGSGVPESAANYSPSPVTDTLIRQKQKRGLFGGYGATLATVPVGTSSAGSETASP